MLAIAAALVAQVACPSTDALASALNKARVSPFVSRIEPVGSVGIHVDTIGGFQIAPVSVSPGEIVWQVGGSAEFATACGSLVNWRPSWTAGRVTGASSFSVSHGTRSPTPLTRFRDTTYRVTPEMNGSRLTIERPGGLQDVYRLNFRATAISYLPYLEEEAVRIETIGLQPDGSVVYAEFRVSPP